MHGYDLTEDDRGLSLDGRLINTDLVGIRNMLWGSYLVAFDSMSRDEAALALDMFNNCQAALGLEKYTPEQ